MGSAKRPAKHGKLLGLVAVGAVVAIVIALFEWNWLRGPLSGYLSARFGRPVEIAGDLHVGLSSRPLLVIKDVSLGNPSWSSEPLMVRADQVSFRIDPVSLWKSPVVLTEVTLTRPRVLLERNADGHGNWEFEGKVDPPQIHGLTIEDGMIHFVNPVTSTNVSLQVAASTPAGTVETPVQFSGSGRLRNRPFTIQGSGSSLLNLENGEQPYWLDVHARAGDTIAEFNGTVVPRQIDNVNGQLSLQGSDLSQLYPIIPVPVPWTPPYRLSGRLKHVSAVWYFHGFSGKVGDSDLAGELSVDRSKAKPLIDADLVSARLDYKDLGGFVGLPPGERSQSASTRIRKASDAKQAESTSILSTKPYDLERLRAVDARVRFKGQRFVTTDLPLDNMTARLDLQDAVLKLQPLDFGVAGGHVASTLTLDARSDVIKTHADVRIEDVELKKVLPAVKPPQGSAGKAVGRARFVASGNSVAQMLSSSNGEFALMSRGGDASALAIVLTNLDLASAVPLLLKGDQSSPIRCVVADMVANEGQLTAKTLVMDTDAENIVGEGMVDFKAERYDLKLSAKSKRASLVALRGPILVDGPLKQPHVHPAPGPVAARIGSSVALGALTPPAALIPLIDLGGGKDADCDALITQAMQNVETLKLASANPPRCPARPRG